MDELFPLVDEEGRVIGQEFRSVCHNGSKLLHPVVHLHVFNRKGELFLQKRSDEKDIQPGKWDTSVGGHVDFGEPVEDALIREAREELNIRDFSFDFLYKYIFESEIEKELVYSFKTIYEEVISIDQNEISDGRFWTLDEIRKNIGKDVFTPNFENEFRLLFETNL